MQTVRPEDAKNKCVLLNEKLQEFIINYQMACSGSLYFGTTLVYSNETVLIFMNRKCMHVQPIPFQTRI